MICKLALAFVLLCAFYAESEAQRGTFDLVNGQPSPLRPNIQNAAPQYAPGRSPYQQTRFRRDVETDDIPHKHTYPAPPTGDHHEIPATSPLSDPVPKQPRTRRDTDEVPRPSVLPAQGTAHVPIPATSPIQEPVEKQGQGRKRRDADKPSSEETTEIPDHHDHDTSRQRRDVDKDKSDSSPEDTSEASGQEDHDIARKQRDVDSVSSSEEDTSESSDHEDHPAKTRRDVDSDKSTSSEGEETSAAPVQQDHPAKKRRDVDSDKSSSSEEEVTAAAPVEQHQSRKRRDTDKDDSSSSTEESSEPPKEQHSIFTASIQGTRKRRSYQVDAPIAPTLPLVPKDPRFRRQAEESSEETSETPDDENKPKIVSKRGLDSQESGGDDDSQQQQGDGGYSQPDQATCQAQDPSSAGQSSGY